MSSYITVSYDKENSTGNNTGKIVISQNASSNINVPTSNFLGVENTGNIKKPKVKQNLNDVHFTTLQKYIRYLDCVKDAKIHTSATDAAVIIYDDNFGLTFEVLNTLEREFNTYTEQIRQKYSWTKKTKDSTLDPILDTRVVFKESGLNPEYFIQNPIRYVGNIATEVIDPAGRSPIESKDIKFPDNGNTLELKDSFMSFFGFDNCSLTATRIGTGKYKYNIKIGSIIRNTVAGGTQKSTTTKRKRSDTNSPPRPPPSKRKTVKQSQNDPPLPPPPSKRETSINSNGDIIIDETNGAKWFIGNKEKNKLIKGNKSTIEKRAFFLAKEMGDVLQVLIMFIWSKLNQTESYCITTCDNVVCLLCMILQVNCILTSAEKATATTKKMRTIDVFEPSGNTPEKAFARFEFTKKGILTHNEKFIKCLTILKSNQADIHISGITEPFKIPDDIYDKFIQDLEGINSILKKQTVVPTQAASITDSFTKAIKINFTLIEFIRISKQRKVSITMHNSYTSNNVLWIQLLNPSKGNYIYNRTVFYKLIKEPGLTAPTAVISTTPPPTKANSATTPMQVEESAPDIPINIPLNNAISIEKDEGFQSPISIMFDPDELDLGNALKFDLGEPIDPEWYNTTYKTSVGGFIGGTDTKILQEISYLEYPDTAMYYDKDENEEYNLYDELTRQLDTHLHKINKTLFYDHVYTSLLHYFYLTGEVLYGNELKIVINKMFSFASIKSRITIRRGTLKVKSEPKTPPTILPLQNIPSTPLRNPIVNTTIEPKEKTVATSRRNKRRKNNRNIGKLLNAKSASF